MIVALTPRNRRAGTASQARIVQGRELMRRNENIEVERRAYVRIESLQRRSLEDNERNATERLRRFEEEA